MDTLLEVRSMKDSYGRNIDYARISLTNRCNLKCIYCMPEENIVHSGSYNDNLDTDEILMIVKALISNGITKIRFTGGEPLLYGDITRLISETSKLYGIKDISLTTNGVLLKGMAGELKASGLNRININVSSLKEQNYSRITRGGKLNLVLEGIEEAIKFRLNPIKINTVVIKGVNDDEIDEFIELSERLPVQMRFIELMPIGEGKKYYNNGGKYELSEILKNHSELIPIETLGSVAATYKKPGSSVRIGLIEPISCKFCGSCNRIRITSDGKIKPCLHSVDEIDLTKHLKNSEELIKVISQTILSKPPEHKLDIEDFSRSNRSMYQIGG